jgi:Cu(I)/Ag(I) efflux system membrane fusion protein
MRALSPLSLSFARIVPLLVVAGLAAGSTLGCRPADHAGERPANARAQTPATEARSIWLCPMHPDYTSEQPGTCPICHMDLVEMPVEGGSSSSSGDAAAPPTGGQPAAGTAAATSGAAPPISPAASPAASLWLCPMHPDYTSDRPGTCPICHMDLVEVSGAVADAHQHPTPPPATTPAASATGPAGSRPAGWADVRLDAGTGRLAGVTTTPATREHLRRALRTPGIVRADEARLHRMQSRVGGWVEQLDVATTGQPVRRGQRALTLYSPELLASQQEYLIARENAARFAGSSLPEVRRGGADLEAAARRRLELLEVPPELFARIDQSGVAERTVALSIPKSGYVLEKNVVAGQRIEPGDLLFVIADLSTVWVEADVYEREARLVAVGQTATLHLPSDPTHPLPAKVDFLYPTLDPTSRTLRVRLVVRNPELRLRPGMFVDAELAIDLGEAVVVPDNAVLATGERNLVFVATEDGRLAPREVTLGWRGDGKAQILAGVEAGEAVVTAANFLLDAESRLRAAIAARLAPGGAAATGATTPSEHEGHRP